METSHCNPANIGLTTESELFYWQRSLYNVLVFCFLVTRVQAKGGQEGCMEKRMPVNPCWRWCWAATATTNGKHPKGPICKQTACSHKNTSLIRPTSASILCLPFLYPRHRLLTRRERQTSREYEFSWGEYSRMLWMSRLAFQAYLACSKSFWKIENYFWMRSQLEVCIGRKMPGRRKPVTKGPDQAEEKVILRRQTQHSWHLDSFGGLCCL